MRPAMRPPLILLLVPIIISMYGAAFVDDKSLTPWLHHLPPNTLARSFPRLNVIPSGSKLHVVPNNWQHVPNTLVPVKRDPLGINARGFHEDVFHRDYGSFHPMRRRRNAVVPRDKRSTNGNNELKRRPEMDSAGFYGDTFSNGYGEFWPLKKRLVPVKSNEDWRRWYKRKPEMDSSGFFGDTFSNGFGDFWTMKKKNDEDKNKRKPEMDSAGFYGDTFSNGFGDFWTVKKKYEKRRPEMDSAGFYGDTFSNGFGDFWTVKKRSSFEKTEHDGAPTDIGASPSIPNQ